MCPIPTCILPGCMVLLPVSVLCRKQMYERKSVYIMLLDHLARKYFLTIIYTHLITKNCNINCTFWQQFSNKSKYIFELLYLKRIGMNDNWNSDRNYTNRRAAKGLNKKFYRINFSFKYYEEKDVLAFSYHQC